MRILGIDPGYAIVGYGVIDYDGSDMQLIGMGAITTEAGTPFEKRLLAIYSDMRVLLQNYKPDELSIEKLYFGNNKTTGIGVGEARGVILLAATQFGLPIYEYTPSQVKSGITGYGNAEKQQVQEMTRVILHLKNVPKPDDTADAVAMAMCHAYSVNSRRLVEGQKRRY
ncbi:Holliday junction endonuclease RuvC [Ruminococcus sp. YE71]|uniref:crossover junction endodeoxyribonuclease RuvC n=1 Tax=unclassified Ruminococcus TaxID=2608920 RepID=UPI000881A4D4|nr:MULTISPECIES: crossover junction endodeoxyribonuclease RuvC [unclassified Ruminococcus]SDA16201.1 Holliday junction endonuclease RuvC [Ruminococcus sp. YE78]SFW24175.1 Holliday junction endonuclease RuvC [Ruminococcus sp. YE71]